MQIIPHFFFVFPPPRLTSPASATSSAIVPRPAFLSPLASSPISYSPSGRPIGALRRPIASKRRPIARRASDIRYPIPAESNQSRCS